MAWFGFVTVLCIVLVSCPFPTQPDPVPDPSASLTAVGIVVDVPVLVIGGTTAITVTATYSDGTTADVSSTATWGSSDETVATADAGSVTAGSVSGSATLTTTVSDPDGDVTETTTVTVIERSLLISEVRRASAANSIEIFNTSTSTVNLDGYALYFNGALLSSLPSYSLAPDNTVRLNDSATVGTEDLYIGTTMALTSEGALELVQSSSGTGVDFVRWGGNSQTPAFGSTFGLDYPVGLSTSSPASGIRRKW